MNTDVALLAAPLAAGLLVLSTHVPLGTEVLRRGIIFLDLAIAQVASLGVLAATLLDIESPIAIQAAAVSAALVGAVVLDQIERRWPHIQEALIGLIFVSAAAAGILLLSGHPHGGEHLQDMLAGQILWTGWERLGSIAPIQMLLLWVWFGHRQRIGRIGFYLVFAVTVTISVQLVGVLLVFASLIAPAVSGSWTKDGSANLPGAYAVGAAGYLVGLWLSAAQDLPAGAAIVCSLSAAAALRLLLGRTDPTTVA